MDAGLGDLPEDRVAELVEDYFGDGLGDLADDAPEVARPFRAIDAGQATGSRATKRSRRSSRQLSIVDAASGSGVAVRSTPKR